VLTITINGVAGNWNTGPPSTLNATLSTDPLGGTENLGINASVVGGPLTGDSVVAVPVVAYPNLDCLWAGLQASALHSPWPCFSRTTQVIGSPAARAP
jgi:hypothetical protein